MDERNLRFIKEDDLPIGFGKSGKTEEKVKKSYDRMEAKKEAAGLTVLFIDIESDGGIVC